MRTQIIRGRRIESCLDSSVRCGSHFPTAAIPVLCGLAPKSPPDKYFRWSATPLSLEGTPHLRAIEILSFPILHPFIKLLRAICQPLLKLASNWEGPPLATQSQPVSRAKKATIGIRLLYSFPATMSEAKQAHCVRCREQTQYVGRQETMAVARGHLHCIPQDLFLVRADPDYKREGPWYDWVMVLFEGGGESFAELDKRCLQYQPDVVPAKVLALAKHPQNGTVMALVHPAVSV